MNFVVGDKVKRIKASGALAEWKVGIVGTIEEILLNGGLILKEWTSPDYNHDPECYVLYKPKQYKFALQYELDSDPTEYFDTLDQVRTRIKELASRSDLKRNRIFIHEIKKTKRVELEVEIIIK